MNADRCNSQGRTAERGNKSAAWRSPDHVVAFLFRFRGWSFFVSGRVRDVSVLSVSIGCGISVKIATFF